MKHIILISILFLCSVTFASESYSAESATFSLNAQSIETYSAESDFFAINFDSAKTFAAESATFFLTGIDEIPEPSSLLFILFQLLFIRFWRKFNF